LQQLRYYSGFPKCRITTDCVKTLIGVAAPLLTGRN